MTIDEFEKLAEQYLETLDDSSRDDWYTTDRTFSSYGVYNFIEWLRAKQTGLWWNRLIISDF